jgi:hypothetical protein
VDEGEAPLGGPWQPQLCSIAPFFLGKIEDEEERKKTQEEIKK